MMQSQDDEHKYGAGVRPTERSLQRERGGLFMPAQTSPATNTPSSAGGDGGWNQRGGGPSFSPAGFPAHDGVLHDDDDEVKEDHVDLSMSGTPEDAVRINHRFEGDLHKLSRPLLGLCKQCLRPTWKKRFFVISGGFLFRYQDIQHRSPKGEPIPLSTAILAEKPDEEVDDGLTFQITTLNKVYVLRAASVEAKNRWLHELVMARDHAIKVSMGHAKASKGERIAAETGSSLLRRKRKEKEQDAQVRQTLLMETRGPATF